MDVAKRLIDHGFHPPTIYFPLVVQGAIMIEPTETESKETLDRFVEGMRAVAEQAAADADGVKAAPTKPVRARLDEIGLYKRMFFVYHSGEDASGGIETEDERVIVIGPEKLAEMVIDAGLVTWLTRKVS